MDTRTPIESANPAITERIDLVIRDLETSIEEFRNLKIVLEKIELSHIGSSVALPFERRNGQVVLRNHRAPLRSNITILAEQFEGATSSKK